MFLLRGRCRSVFALAFLLALVTFQCGFGLELNARIKTVGVDGVVGDVKKEITVSFYEPVPQIEADNSTNEISTGQGSFQLLESFLIKENQPPSIKIKLGEGVSGRGLLMAL